MCAVFPKANHSNHRIGAHADANHTGPYGAALMRWPCPRHFVPGYDRTVPPGLGAKASFRARKREPLNWAIYLPTKMIWPSGFEAPPAFSTLIANAAADSIGLTG
jgi:hypothetical protein